MLVKVLNEKKQPINSDQWDEIRSAVLDLKSKLYRKYTAKCNDELMIDAAKEVAKEYNVRYQDILKNFRPSFSVKDAKVWDKEGKVYKWNGKSSL